MDILKEAGNLAAHINKNVVRGFKASLFADRSVHVEFSDHEYSFDVVLVADSAYNVFVIDFCPIGMQARPYIHNHRERLGFFTLALAEYNIKLSKRLAK